jgi:hypothetical protein
VLSHGQLAIPGDAAEDWPDLFGQFELPGGAPGVVDVSATNRVVNRPSATCAPARSAATTRRHRTRTRPASRRPTPPGGGAGQGRPALVLLRLRAADRHRGSRRGAQVQPAELRPRRHAGLPVHHADLTNAWETFSTTSNWAVEIPCFTFARAPASRRTSATRRSRAPRWRRRTSPPPSPCSPAHNPRLRHHPAALVALLKRQADRSVHNYTRALDPNDHSPGDLSGLACEFGNCHLGGPRISDREAYGAGLAVVNHL